MPEGSPSARHQGPMGEESPQLSVPLSNTEHDQTHAHSGPDGYSQMCMEPLDGERERPVSLVSTLSSGSSRDSHSLFGSTVALPSSATPPIPSEDDIDLELSPAQCDGEQAREPSPFLTDSRERWKDDRVISNQWNNNNATSTRKGNGDMRHLQASPVITDAMALNPKLTYVDRVVMEIIETERMYVKDLRSIVEDYLAHIIDTTNLPIRPEQVCALFGNIEDIYEFNSELLQSLDMCESDPVAIAQCFVDKSEYFEIYTQYCNNYPNSVATLTDCMRSKNLAKFFRDRQAALKRSLPLGSYLLKPVQRILKYHLLLQEIAKHFGPDEDGYEVVQEALDTMTGVAWYINDMKRKHEHAVRVQEIQSLLINWKGPDLTTYGELVLEGTFHVLRAKNTRTLFLFEKMLLITKKRGESYVYKTHISCSTLMLLDSAKDPLLFSVIHFKHPKQPHTVQARSVEEKCLWSHHIKRLILENHNAIVPQKAKEAVLDNSNYPGKYHYSPEMKRIKKTSYQAEDFHLGARNGRRRSEPVKQILKSAKAVLKHADSEGALLGDRCSLQPASSVSSTLASSLGQPLAEQQSVEDFITTSTNGCDVRVGSSPTERALEPEEVKEAEDEDEEGNIYKEDILMGDDQDDQNNEAADLRTTPLKEIEPHSPGDKQETVAEEEALPTQVTVETLCPLDCASPAESSHQPKVPHSQSPESLHEASTPEPHNTSQETAEEEEEGGSDSSSFQVEETSVLTNGESEEEEEVDKKSILPSSVLDQASVIAERYIHMSRRSSLISEDLGSVACPSPLTDNEPLTSSSACIDLEKDIQVFASSPDPQLSSQEPTLNDLMQEERRSTLSKQDQLLIHKIRRYYEHAEHQDANFSIKRRESLSYIPAGLVRQLSRQLNSAPQEQATPTHRKELSRNRPTSWSVFELPGLDKSQNTETPQTSKPALTDGPDEVFKPSSEMLKVWEEMEINEERGEAQPEIGKAEDLLFQASKDLGLESLERQYSMRHTTKDSEISSMSINPSVPTEEAESVDSKHPKGQFSQHNLPKTISFRTSMEDDQILQDMGKNKKNKVLQLARQYSQRIKNNRPIKWQKNHETGNQQGLWNMPTVQEEKTQLRKRGKPNLRLPLNSINQAVIHEVSSPSPVQTPCSGLSSHSTLTSPQTPQSETFHWPDVQELCSKYTPSREETEVSNSSKFPLSDTVLNETLDRPMNGCRGSSCKYSSSLNLHKALADCPRSKSVPVHRAGRCGVEDWPQPQVHSVLCRWSSLDHMLSSHPLHEVQNFQHPVRTHHTTSQVCLASRDTVKNNDNSHPPEGLDCSTNSAVLSSGKMAETNIVKSLREKFQSLSTNG